MIGHINCQIEITTKYRYIEDTPLYMIYKCWYMNTYKVGQDEISFTIWDTSGSQAYDSIRPLSYNEADIFMLCFSVAGTKENINVFI